MALERDDSRIDYAASYLFLDLASTRFAGTASRATTILQFRSRSLLLLYGFCASPSAWVSTLTLLGFSSSSTVYSCLA